MVIWVRDVGCRDECGVDGGGDMWSKKGRILKSEPTEIANGSEVDVRDTMTMTNSRGRASHCSLSFTGKTIQSSQQSQECTAENPTVLTWRQWGRGMFKARQGAAPGPGSGLGSLYSSTVPYWEPVTTALLMARGKEPGRLKGPTALRYRGDTQVDMSGEQLQVWTSGQRWGWRYKWEGHQQETVSKAKGVDEITQSSFSNWGFWNQFNGSF